MTESPNFSGVYTALATPMHNGQIAYGDLDALVAHQLNGGINGLVSVGTTGESPTLNHAEHIEVIRATVAAAARHASGLQSPLQEYHSVRWFSVPRNCTSSKAPCLP